MDIRDRNHIKLTMRINKLIFRLDPSTVPYPIEGENGKYNTNTITLYTEIRHLLGLKGPGSTFDNMEQNGELEVDFKLRK
jgi:hypothetical protein